MTNLITLEKISLAFGLKPLLDSVNLQIKTQERVCLVGRNGAGKSSLLKVIEGSLKPDAGTIWYKPNLRLARLDQNLPIDSELTVYEFVAQGLSQIGTLLAKYHALTQNLTHNPTDKNLQRLQLLQNEIEAQNGWQFEQSIKSILERLSLNSESTLQSLSGGWQRRAALAKAFVANPEILLLDEPTNHLDIEAIAWLENQLLNADTSLLFITHDRALIKNLATRIVELDRGQLITYECDYAHYLERKAQEIETEAKHASDFNKKLAIEEQWIRQGIKARRTRNEGRVRALKRMREEFAARRNREKSAAFNLNEAEKSGALVVEAHHLTHRYGDQIIIRNFSTRIMRGDKIGLIGPNGIGKTTLLNLLLGEITPQEGNVKLGTKLQIAYFDQRRNHLDFDKTIIDNVMAGSEFLEINGKKQHIYSYLNDFLFTPERARTPVKALSGGEVNRVLIARLFSQPFNLLVLDEPTNDLDIETLELLEEKLSEYKGTLLLVSHDRAFLDAVVSNTFVFEGQGIVSEYVGGYQDWVQQRASVRLQSSVVKTEERSIPQKLPAKKLSYKEQRELAELPEKIEKLEQEQADLIQRMSEPNFYQQEQSLIVKANEHLNTLKLELESAYQRWSELDH